MTTAPSFQTEPRAMAGELKSGLRLLLVDEAIAAGGVERLWLSLAPELARLCQHLVWMLPVHRLDSFRQAMPPGSAVQFESFHWPESSAGKIVDSLGRRIAGFAPPGAAQGLERFLENRRLREVIEKHQITHLLYPALFRQPFPETSLPVTAVVMDINYHPSWREACLQNLADWTQRASTLISISRFTREEIVSRFPAVARKVKAIAITSDGPPANLPNSAGTTKPAANLPCVYYPATLNPHKGHAVLLEALRVLHDDGRPIRLVLTGGGTERLTAADPLPLPEIEKARMLIAQAPEAFRQNIEARGIVPMAAVEDYFAAADLVVLPSAYEGFGLPLAEAVACGKRVLCADIPAFREQIEIYGFDKAVTFVPEPTVAAWARALRQAFANQLKAPYSSEQLRTLFARRTWSDVAKQYVQAMEVLPICSR